MRTRVRVARLRLTDIHRDRHCAFVNQRYFSSSFTSPLALPKSIWPA